jgi:hypothetical protein
MIKGQFTTLPISSIETDSRLQVRSHNLLSAGLQTSKEARLDDQHDRLVNTLKAGGVVEPIRVIKSDSDSRDEDGFSPDSDYLVFDGHHRLKAFKDHSPLDNPEVPVEILPYSFKEALSLGYTVNMTHGEGLTDKERTQAALRSCVYNSSNTKPKDIKRAVGIAQSTAEKITRAARRLKDEADIQPNDTPGAIDKKVCQWVNDQPPEYYREGRLPLFRLDSHGFPTYGFILERKVGRENETDAFKVQRLVQKLEALVDEDYDIFRAALKKVAHKKNRDLKVTVKDLNRQQENVKDEDDEF